MNHASQVAAVDSNLSCELPRPPGVLVTLPQGSTQVLDVDEEVFILYSRHVENRDEDGIQGLGSVDSLADSLTLNFVLSSPSPAITEESKAKGRGRHRKAQSSKPGPAEKVVEIEVFQDVTGLRSRKGDTGSVVWRASVHLAKLLLQQYYFPPHPPHSALLSSNHISNAKIVELGSGTGVLGCALRPLLSGNGHITLTDLPELTPLLRKNAKSAKVSVEPLDWTWQIIPQFTADLVLCVDCIYNTALVRPLVRALGTFDAPILVVIELRDEDVVREFLYEWLAWRPRAYGDGESWGISSLATADDLLSPRFVAWVGWKV
ncbi:protein-lysine methyltransferase C42C1,13 [Rhizoctonia solani]|uniref:Protein-lysine methyltransferase C42C1,13 n=1 Tax=Rhizoctonia solani TaxID=456999 RepID=A0A8H8SST1_9AGAM|nr:protein-lysine methyltransferase C42C1,13 [Rhizoctonia solani]QRW17111.1 protein-lysine methyltransferase C42C1,13 [Rhizoctonia solani]